MQRLFGYFVRLNSHDWAIAICALFSVLVSGVPAAGVTYTPFDPTGSTGTRAQGINDKGEITGGYFDSSGDHYCYLRHSDGSITSFGQALPYRCYASDINSRGLITGEIEDQTAQCGTEYVGYVRAQNGTLTTFAPPASVSTHATGINTTGEIAGYYQDGNCVYHGFLRVNTGSGVFTVIDVKNAAGTLAQSINASGTITGFWTDADGNQRGFYFVPGGAGRQCSKGGCTYPFQVQGSQGTDRGSGEAINDSGVITGEYTDANGAYHGFVREGKDNFTTLNAPGAGTGSGQGTFPLSINANGNVAGHFLDGSNLTHGFLWTPNGGLGKYKTFDPVIKGDSPGTTQAYSLNDKDRITGTYDDTTGFQHGYVRNP